SLSVARFPSSLSVARFPSSLSVARFPSSLSVARFPSSLRTLAALLYRTVSFLFRRPETNETKNQKKSRIFTDPADHFSVALMMSFPFSGRA
ncbi:MAG: hypothetical protein II940_02345, partial [Methanosarcinaceae archaeon]|nr:hypothetical protein [Methanosarcinaceae archaeon]